MARHWLIAFPFETEDRFAKHFDKEGNPSPTLLAVQQDRLENWRLLQELAGVK